MNERQVRKVQKNRHMTEIQLNIASNSVFKNLSQRDRVKLAKLIYKAEMVEFYIRERSLDRVNNAFREMIANALMNLDDQLDRMDPEDEDEFGDDDPFK
jgi:myo-inositol-1-phosphate synthase